MEIKHDSVSVDKSDKSELDTTASREIDQRTVSRVDPDLEQAASVMFAQVNVDHLEQPLDLVIAHLAVLVLIGSPQVAPDPGVKGQGINTRLKHFQTQHFKVIKTCSRLL